MIQSQSINQTSCLIVLGIRNQSAVNLTNNSVAWNALSSLLNPLASGTLINSVSQNFVNWNSSANFYIADHLSVNQMNNQIKQIDVTDYVKQVINLGGSQLTFVIYRPFRHPAYQSASPIPADGLSQGSVAKFYGLYSASPPSITYLYSL